MNCDELRDHYELYAMGVASEPEKSEIRVHLNRGCEVCMAEMKRARSIVAVLAGAAPPMAPSPKLRGRILSSVGFEQKRFGWTLFLAAATALSLFAAFYFSGREREFAVLANQLRDDLGRKSVELATLNEAFSILNGPDTVMTTFGSGQPAPPKGRVFMNPSQGVLLIASNLPPAPAGKKYEMWVIPKAKGGSPVPAGLFQSDANNTAMHIRHGALDVDATAAVAVTLENEAGATVPTMPILFVAGLQ